MTEQELKEFVVNSFKAEIPKTLSDFKADFVKELNETIKNMTKAPTIEEILNAKGVADYGYKNPFEGPRGWADFVKSVYIAGKTKDRVVDPRLIKVLEEERNLMKTAGSPSAQELDLEQGGYELNAHFKLCYLLETPKAFHTNLFSEN